MIDKTNVFFEKNSIYGNVYLTFNSLDKHLAFASSKSILVRIFVFFKTQVFFGKNNIFFYLKEPPLS